jgi:hypothetical protein
MKLSKFIYGMIFGMMLFSLECNASVQTSQNDSILNAIKIKNLKDRKAELKKRIATEDKKRNTVIEGVSPETLEKIIERQDSICLELRSELTAVELELKELGADIATTQIAQQFNRLIQSNRPDTTQMAVPNMPTPPAMPDSPSKAGKPKKSVKKK